MSSALAIHQPDAPALFSDDRVDLIRRTIANGAPPLEFDMFMAVCKRTGLDPLAKQIYFIQRGGKWQWQTSIDGYRLTADRTGAYAGSDDAVFEESADGKPKKATVTVWKIVKGVRCPFTATARWSEYSAAQGLWTKMPHTMLAKCAEALALRKAFPAELSGVYTSDEMQQADNDAEPAPAPIRTITPQPARTVDPGTGEIIEAETRPVDATGSITQAQKDSIKGILTDLGQPFSYANQISKSLFNKPVVRLTQAEGQEVLFRLNTELTSEMGEPILDPRDVLDNAAAEKGVTDEGELRYALALLFTDFPDKLEEWTPAQVAHAAGWFAGQDAEAVKAAIEGAG